MTIFAPSTVAETAAVIADAAGNGRKLDIRGGGSKASIGSEMCEADILDVSAIAGIVDYDPAELVLTVRPATLLAEVEALLAASRQMLAFEPHDVASALGSAAAATIGGTVAAGLAGSRRLTRGGARDHLLGFTAVSGRGEVFVAGGKVVKNVTGYDLPKLLAGSWGRLAVFTEITLKALPAPRERETRAVMGLSPEQAWLTMAGGLGSQAEISAAAYVPARGATPSITAFRFEGIAHSIAARISKLELALGEHPLAPLENPASFWRGLQTLDALADARQLWRVILPARGMPELARSLDEASVHWLADWAGGLIWTDWAGDAANLRRRVASLGGQAVLFRAGAETRASVPAFHPLPPGLDHLEQKVRRAFDPAGVFETGRF